MDENAHRGPAPSQADHLGSVLMAAGQALSQKDRTIAERERAIVERDKKIAELECMLVMQQQTVNEQRRTIAQRNATIAEHQHASTEHQRTITERDQTIARISKHSRWLEYHSGQVAAMATAAVAAHSIITLGNGAPPGNVGPDEDAPSRDDTAPRAPTPDEDTPPRVASPDEDAPPRVAAPRNDAPPRGVPTGNDDTHTVVGPNTTARSGAGSSSAARTTVTHNVAVPADEIAESAQVTKRQRVNQQVRNGSEQIITIEDLFEVVGPIAFTDIGVLADIYEALKGCPLIPARVAPEEFTRRLAGLEGFARWTPRFKEAESSELSGLNLLRRSDCKLESLRPNVLRQLGLEGQPGAVVLGPRLWYVLVSTIGIPLEQVTGRILEKAFKKLINKSLRSLLVVTRNSVRKMSPGELWNLAKTWARKLIEFIVGEDGTRRLQEAVTQCNRYYMSQCPMDANGARSDPTGNIAKEVLDGSSDCRLFLGLNEDFYDLEALCKRFFAIGDGSVEQHTVACLRQIADS